MTTTHGGRRPGAGRPQGATGTAKVRVSYTLPADVVEWLRNQTIGSQARVIEQALRRCYPIGE